MRNYFDKQLDTLHDKMIHMGELCVDSITNAIKILVDDDEAMVAKVMEIENEIDQMERDIESLCMKLILHQQPVATDLRKISSALKMISDMERIGDQASDIAEISMYIIGKNNNHETNLEKMAVEAQKMVSDSIQSFVNDDLKMARSVIEYDDVVDDCFAKIKRELVRLIASDSSQGEYYIDLLMIAKYLERIGDHATNIGEWVEYSVTGSRAKGSHKSID
ncbi:MAG: phosphate signaling complex protein PhoU [Bacillota bacterium]|jgi:phosphate transport system protein